MEGNKMNYNQFAKEIYSDNYNWWHDASGSKLERNRGQLLMLAVTEVAESCEGLRKDLYDDHLPHRKMVEVELADTMIRLLDFAGGFDIEISDHEDYQWRIDNSENESEGLLVIVDEILSIYNGCETESIDIRFALNAIVRHAELYNYDIFGSMAEKREYNKKRADHKIENRMIEGGKKF